MLHALLLIAPVVFAGSGPEKAPELPTPDYTITNTNVVDVVSGTIKPGCFIVVRGDRIDVFDGVPTTKGPAHPPIDGAGLYVIPGLIDSHVHYIDEETFGKLFIANGVAFVREMGNDTRSVLNLRDRLNTGQAFGPHMIAAGAIVDGKPPVWPFSEACDTPEEARAAVQRLKAAGVDFIKVYSLLKPEVYHAALDEARAQGLRAAGHIPESVTADDACDAGQITSEHLLGLQDLILGATTKPGESQPPHAGLQSVDGWLRLEQADPAALTRRLARLKGMVHVPTLVVMEGIVRAAKPDAASEPLLQYTPAPLRTFWSGDRYAQMAKGLEPALPAMIKAVGLLHRAGVPLLIGTDLANPYVFAGFSLHREMELFQQAGIPPADILRMATVAPAKLFGVEHDFGTVDSGRAASFVLLSANPLDDIRNTQRIVGVFHQGAYYDRAALDALLADVRQQVRAEPSPAGASIRLDPPGELVARGRYTLTFTRGAQSFPAGIEDFAIGRDETGTFVLAHGQPQGGWAKPTLTRLHISPQGRLIDARYEELTKKPTAATYSLTEGKLVAVPDDGKPIEIAAPPGVTFSGPSTAGAFSILLASPLEPGHEVKLTVLGFGYPGWAPDSTQIALRREVDAPAPQKPDHPQARPVRHYISRMSSPMGEIEQRLWVDERLVVQRLELVAPFGVISAQLDPP